MKKSFYREGILFLVPSLALLGLGFVFSNVGGEPNGIQVVNSGIVSPKPYEVQNGADVAVRLELKPLPNHQPNNWKANFRVVAAQNKLVWSSSGQNPHRDINISWHTGSGSNYLRESSFNLDTIPAHWGEIALQWDAELTHTTKRWFRTKTLQSRRSGTIILRRAGQKIAAPAVSHANHLQLLRYEIGKPKMEGYKKYAYFVYPVKFFFERDATSRKEAQFIGNEAPFIDCDYQVKPRKGFANYSWTNGSEEITVYWYDSSDAKGENARRYPIVTNLSCHLPSPAAKATAAKRQSPPTRTKKGRLKSAYADFAAFLPANSFAGV